MKLIVSKITIENNFAKNLQRRWNKCVAKESGHTSGLPMEEGKFLPPSGLPEHRARPASGLVPNHCVNGCGHFILGETCELNTE